MVFVKYVIREMFQKTHVIRDLNENRLVIRDRDPPLQPCVVVEVKYFSTQNDVIHTENCNLELPLDCSTTQMERNIRRMCGIEESSRQRGFADFAVEVFYIDFDSLELLKKSLSSIKANIQDSPLFPGYKMRLNMESLLTLYVENQP